MSSQLKVVSGEGTLCGSTCTTGGGAAAGQALLEAGGRCMRSAGLGAASLPACMDFSSNCCYVLQCARQ